MRIEAVVGDYEIPRVPAERQGSVPPARLIRRQKLAGSVEAPRYGIPV